MLPNIVKDDAVFSLMDLVTSDFKMNSTDQDYELSHEQLIKASKILLYKMNLMARKNTYERGELASMVNERTERVEKLAKSNLTEVTTFLHTVHSDFESFLSKHKKEHNSMNMRLLKVTEDMSTVMLQFKPIKQSMD
jgi:hypothetical protein